MAKKQKRSISTGMGASPSFISSPTAVSSSPRASYVQEFKPDYSYVSRDLKKIAALAGGFVVVLVGLSFVLR